MKADTENSLQKQETIKVETEDKDIWHQINSQLWLKNQRKQEHINIVKKQSPYTINIKLFCNKKQKNKIGNFITTLKRNINTQLLPANTR